MSTKHYKRVSLWRIGLGLAGFAVVLACGYRSYNATYVSKSWLPVPGRVMVVMSMPIMVSEGKFNRTIGEGHTRVVRYTYKVGSVSYESSNVGDGPGALEAAQKIKVDDLVNVYVNEMAPSQSVLYPGLSASAKVSLIICSLAGLALILIALAPSRQLD